MATIEEVIKHLGKISRVMIVSHIMPDGDSIGSAIALDLAISSLGVDVVNVCAHKVPEHFRFLEGSDRIVLPSVVTRPPQTIVFLDCTGLDRVSQEVCQLMPEKRIIVNIDHHISNEMYGNMNLVDAKAAATGELVFHIIKQLDVNLNRAIVEALYVAIATDTGSFQYENTSPTTMRIAASLLESGARLETIRENIWESKPRKAMELLATALNRLQFGAGGKLAWITLDRDTLNRLGVNDEHADGLINYAKSIQGVEVALLFKETETGEVKVSFRSKKQIDVNQLAHKFGGGGHRRASGCSLQGDLNSVVTKVIGEVNRIL